MKRAPLTEPTWPCPAWLAPPSDCLEPLLRGEPRSSACTCQPRLLNILPLKSLIRKTYPGTVFKNWRTLVSEAFSDSNLWPWFQLINDLAKKDYMSPRTGQDLRFTNTNIWIFWKRLIKDLLVPQVQPSPVPPGPHFGSNYGYERLSTPLIWSGFLWTSSSFDLSLRVKNIPWEGLCVSRPPPPLAQVVGTAFSPSAPVFWANISRWPCDIMIGMTLGKVSGKNVF